MTDNIKATLIAFGIIAILITCALWYGHETPLSGELEAVRCPVCEKCEVCPSCTITADRIIRDNPAIELPDELIKFKYKGVEYSKEILDTAKITIENK